MTYWKLCGMTHLLGSMVKSDKGNIVKILITGAGGYLGGNLVNRLANSGHELLLASRNKNLANFFFRRHQFIDIDWESSGNIIAACENVDVVIHLAAINAQNCQRSPKAAFEFNGNLTSSFAEAAYSAGVKKFIYLSTAHVYESPLANKYTEESLAANHHPYAASKILGEQGVLNKDFEGRMKSVIFRLSNCIGAPFHASTNCWQLVTNDLCRQAIENKVLSLRSMGVERRNFITMEDFSSVVEYFCCSANATNLEGIFNVGGAWTPSILELAKTVVARCEKTIGYAPQITLDLEHESFDNFSFEYDTKKLNSLGVLMQNNYIRTIDELLLFCQRTFHQEQR